MARARGDGRSARRTAAPRGAAWLGALLGLAGCAGAGAPPPVHEPPTTSSHEPLLSVARRVAAEASPELARRLSRDPFRFFRYVTGPFTGAACRDLPPSLRDLPEVNLHGDAHVEQYAVAEDGRGLADFDAATSGPFAIDLLRFATSLRIAAKLRGLGPAEPAIDALLRGYAEALADPDAVGPEPEIVERLRGRFAPTPRAWLDRVEGLMAPVHPAMREKIERASEPFVEAMLRQNPDLRPDFFEVRRMGVLLVGVGSVHEKKFLARVAGPTDAPDDDVIYEVKEVSRIEPGSCVAGDPERDPRRVIRGQIRLSNVHQRLLGFVELEGRSFYVHTWRVNYTELDVGDLTSARDLEEVAYDVGLQLGRGHPEKRWSSPEAPLAREILARLPAVTPEVHRIARALEERNDEAFRALASGLSRGGASGAKGR